MPDTPSERDWGRARSGCGPGIDPAVAVRRLLETTHPVEAEEWATDLEFVCVDGNSIAPIAVPVVAALVDAIPRAPESTRMRIAELIAFIASRESSRRSGDTSERCLRLVATTHDFWLELLRTARTANDFYTCIDVLGICPAGDVRLHGPVLLRIGAGEGRLGAWAGCAGPHPWQGGRMKRQAASAVIRELSWEEAEQETNAYTASLTPAERVRSVAVLTRAAWEGVGRERERFCRVYSYPHAEEGPVPHHRRVRDGAPRARARNERR